MRKKSNNFGAQPPAVSHASLVTDHVPRTTKQYHPLNMNNALDALLVFGFLTFFQFWGGAAIGAGISGRKALPILWGALIGGLPLYFGIERGIMLGAWGSLLWQIATLLVAGLAVGLKLPRLCGIFLRAGMSALMIGTFVMVAGAVAGALLFRARSESLSLIVGGLLFLFGAMWVGSGVQQLRSKDEGLRTKDEKRRTDHG
jgi:hypothetical protein